MAMVNGTTGSFKQAVHDKLVAYPACALSIPTDISKAGRFSLNAPQNSIKS